MKLELSGSFMGKGEVKEVGEHTITKFYIEVDKETEYPTKVEFQFFNDKCDIDKYSKGDQVTVHFNINSRVWESPDKGKLFFQNLAAWKVHSVKQEGEVDVLTKSAEQLPDDDLPF